MPLNSLNFVPERITMGKSSSSAPSFQGGTININGQNRVKTYQRGGSVVTDYKMTDAERDMYDYAQKSFADSLKSVNVFDDDTKKNLQDEVNAYTLQGQKMINNMYTPLLENLKNDVASRFGNLDNSVFLDKLNSIESKRADSMNSLAQDILAKQDDVVKKELTKRYTYLSFLQDVQNQINSNMYNLINASKQHNSSGNTNSQNSNSNSMDMSNYINLATNLASIFM